MAATAPSPLIRRRNRIMVSLGALSVGAWLVLIWQARGMGGQSMGLTMGMDAGLFLAVWVVMMMAMMFPAAAPMILIFAQVQAGKERQGREPIPIWLFTGTYLALWSVVGVLAYVAALALQHAGDRVAWIGNNGTRFGGLLLIAAGIYQLSALKRICLAKCRSPLAFVMTSWRDGRIGAVRMGLTHGLYCLGCCWLLFAILFPLGMMNIAVLAVVTLLIFAEKSLPLGDRLAWAVAAVLIVYGLAVVVSPGILPVQAPQQMNMPM